MKEFKGTPGPWRVEDENIVTSELAGFICESHGDNTSWEEDQHNANLIAAAPDLLEALKKCTDALEEVSYQSWCGEIIEESRAAIAKALGESK